MASLMARITGTLIEKLVQPTFQPDYPIEKQRQRLDLLQKFAPMPLGVRKIKTTLAGVPAWRLTPLAADDTKKLLYLHGGGYVSGSPQSHADMVARIAKQTGLTASLIDYRLAPEHVFPAAVEDALSAYKELAKDSAVIIAGDSAGGGLALAVTQAIREAGMPMPNALVLFSPWIDLTCSGESFSERAERERLLTPQWVSQMAPKYAGEISVEHPQISPLHADFTDFPPTLIQVGSEEILYSDSIRLKQKMAAANVPVVLSEYPEMWHVFQLHAGYMPESKRALKEFAAFIA